MGRTLSRRTALRLTAGAITVLARAQQATFSTAVDVVNVLVTVRDRKGDLVRGLTKDDFTLQEDGRTQPIRYFSQQTDQPLTIGLLVDVSGSQRTLLAEQRRAGRKFVDQVLRGPQDRAFLVLFDREIELPGDLTFPEREVKQDAAQGTVLYDAIVTAARTIAAQPGRKALIILSDGYDTSSSATLNGAVETAQRADALVYSIRSLDRAIFAFPVSESRGGSPVPREGGKALERIARETGGEYFDLTAAEKLASIYSRIEEQLRNQYSLGFAPGPTRGKVPSAYRKIRVSIKRKGLTVQARDGYYPAP